MLAKCIADLASISHESLTDLLTHEDCNINNNKHPNLPFEILPHDVKSFKCPYVRYWVASLVGRSVKWVTRAGFPLIKGEGGVRLEGMAIKSTQDNLTAAITACVCYLLEVKSYI